MTYTGTVMEISDRLTYVFTSDCRMRSVKTKEEYFVGKQIQFTEQECTQNIFFTRTRKILSFAVAAALLIVSIPVFAMLINKEEPTAVCTALVYVDINPGVALEISQDNVILSAKSTNLDGEKVLDGLSLNDQSLSYGFGALLDKADSLGYFSSGNSHVMVSATLRNNAGLDDPNAYKEELDRTLAGLAQVNSNVSVLTAVVCNEDVLDDAAANTVSPGRELIYKFALSNGITLTLEQVQSLNISELLAAAGASDTDGVLTDAFKAFIRNPEESCVTTPDTTQAPETTTAPEVTTDPVTMTEPATTTVPKTTEPDQTTKETKTAVQTTNNEKDYRLSVSKDGDALAFSWTKLSQDSVTKDGKTYNDFCFYKIVASATDSTPIYPDNGYLYYTTNRGDTSWSVNPQEDCYNQSPELKPGKTYYFSITYVFDNGKFTSQTVQIKVPGSVTTTPEETNTAFCDPSLSVSASGNKLQFNWSELPDSDVSHDGKDYNNFCYYKVVASATDSTPTYPENGYLYYTTDCGKNSWSVNPSKDDYNESPKLEAGKTYYFSITYVFENGYIYTDAVRYKVPAQAVTTTPTDDFTAPVLTVSQSDGTLNFSWTGIDGDVTYGGKDYSTFYYYKVVASQTNPKPVYPDDGYLYFTTDTDETDWSLNPTECDAYNQNPELISGKSYYFSITYVYETGKFSSNTVKVTIQ
ncbi:MAG: anti-sigma factor domain-containing protein [Oscillospiraceae bacterium]